MYTIVITTIIFSVLITESVAVHCYNCHDCDDVKDLGAPDDCNIIKADANFCRTITDSAGTVYRHCSKHDELPAGCYEVSGLVDCKCLGDGCNAATSAIPAGMLFILPLILLKV